MMAVDVVTLTIMLPFKYLHQLLIYDITRVLLICRVGFFSDSHNFAHQVLFKSIFASLNFLLQHFYSLANFLL